jgi:hypothetical protein
VSCLAEFQPDVFLSKADMCFLCSHGAEPDLKERVAPSSHIFKRYHLSTYARPRYATVSLQQAIHVGIQSHAGVTLQCSTTIEKWAEVPRRFLNSIQALASLTPNFRHSCNICARRQIIDMKPQVQEF